MYVLYLCNRLIIQVTPNDKHNCLIYMYVLNTDVCYNILTHKADVTPSNNTNMIVISNLN